MIVMNTTDKSIKIKYKGTEYQLIPQEPVDIPDDCCQLYFAYGLELNPEIIHWCCERLRANNPELVQMSDKYVWDNIVNKIDIGAEIVKKLKKR